MRSNIFLFLGVIETGSNANLTILKARLEEALAQNFQPIQFNLKETQLILTLSKPDFRIYLSFEKNDHENLKEWKQLARDFELPWDIKPIDKSRLEDIFARLKAEGWSVNSPIYKLGFTILQEMEKFKNVKVFTIPSIGRRTLWNRFF